MMESSRKSGQNQAGFAGAIGNKMEQAKGFETCGHFFTILQTASF